MPKTLLLAGPSGIGKTYLGELLCSTYSQHFEHAKIYTTRSPRPGEKSTDRIFISSDEFDLKKSRGEFLVHGELGGNRYGFSHSSMFATNKHLVLNIWPNLLDQFTRYPDMVAIGLQADTHNIDMLNKRMKDRGDSDDTIGTRQSIIQRDIAELNQYRTVIDAFGKLFVIKDNSTIHDQVMPWIIDHFGL